MIRLIITDDHPIVRQGLKQIFEECPEIRTIDEAADGAELVQKIIKNTYDVALLDISMPGRNGLTVLEEIKSIQPKLNVLMLSIYPEEQYAIKALKLGASGYLLKSSSPPEIILAIQKVANGGKFISPFIAEKLVGSLYSENPIDKPLHENLSAREIEVLCLLAQGKSVSDIASELFISSKSVSTYKQRLLVKLGLKTVADIVRYAIKEGLVQ